MPKQNVIATNFTSGEVSPFVRGRVDAQKYANGLETCENFIVRPQGPIERRSGTKYLGTTKYPSEKKVLIPFEYSDTQGYVLEFGRGYIHFWKNDGKLFETTNTEVEQFDTSNESGLTKISAPISDLPAFGSYSIFNGVGDIFLNQNKNGKLRVTTSVPHTLRTGVDIPVGIFTKKGTVTAIVSTTGTLGGTVRATSANHNLITGDQITLTGNFLWCGTRTVTVVDANTFDINGTSWESSLYVPSDWYLTNGNTPKTIADNSAVPVSSSGRVIITTSTPHGYVENDAVAVHGATSVSVPPDRSKFIGFWKITNVTQYTFELIGSSNPNGDWISGPGTSGGLLKQCCKIAELQVFIIYSEIVNDYTFDAQSLSGTVYNGDFKAIAFCGTLPGDRVFVSGAIDVPELKDRFVIVDSIGGYDTGPTPAEYDLVVNIPKKTAGSPAQEELWTIPIEISTDYGYTPSKRISSISNNGVLVRVNLPGHGYSTGDTIQIYSTNNSADGQWVITVISDTSFDLVGSVYKSSSTVGYARKVLDYETELQHIRFVQSNDVLYVMHPRHPVYKLTRLSNDGDRNDWLWAKVNFKDGPYLPVGSLAPSWDQSNPSNGPYYPDVYWKLSSYTHTATAIAQASFATTDAGKYFEYRDGDQWRLALAPASIPSSTYALANVEIIDNVLLYLDETTKLTGQTKWRFAPGINRKNSFRDGGTNSSTTAPGANRQSKLDPSNYLVSTSSKVSSNFANTFGQPDIGKYVRFNESGTRWAQITSVSDGGKSANHSATAVASKSTINANTCSNNNTGEFVIKDHNRTAVINSYKAGIAFACFTRADVGRLFRVGWGGRWAWGVITSYTSSSQVSVFLYEDPPRDPHNAANLAGATGTATDSGITYDWRLGSWSERTGYPTCGVFHEQRLWFAATDTEPQAMWGSISGDFENFSPTESDSTVLEDNAVNFTLGSAKANPIKWLMSGPTITVGTIGNEWQVKSSSVSSEPITPLNIVVVPHTGHGSNSRVQPLRIGGSTIFADRPGYKIRELVYDFQVDALASKDLTYLSEHILKNGNGAIESAYQQEPNGIGWYVLSDGTAAAVTVNKDQEIVSWHRHSIGGGLIESIAVVPSSDLSNDSVYFVINRNGFRYVELLQQNFEPSGQSLDGMRFLDGFVAFDNISNGTIDTQFDGVVIAGLFHLEGQYATVVSNGSVLGTYAVNGGRITLPALQTQTNAEIVVGIPYTSTAKSLPPEGGSAFGVSQGKIKKISKYNVRLLNSLSLDYGFNANSQSLNSITNLHENGTSTGFYTGTKELIPNNPYDAESQWTLSTSKPYPLNILSVTLTVETGE